MQRPVAADLAIDGFPGLKSNLIGALQKEIVRTNDE
jgi:hypothetical protein